MEKQNNVPRLRFPEFADIWEKRQITELLKDSPSAMKIGPFGSSLKKESFVASGIKVYAQENTFTEDFSIGDYYITEEKYNELKSCELFPNDLVISMMGTVGACAIFPKTAEKGIMNSHLLRLQFNESVMPEYIKIQLKDSTSIRKQIDKLSVGSIMNGLSSSVVKKLVFPMTCIEEQNKIVSHFKLLDNLITLHQRKLDQMKEYKKGMLQKMFPKDGETVPEIRFPGFGGEWEQYKCKDLFDFVKAKNTTGDNNNVITNSAEYGLIPQRDFFDKDIAVEGKTEKYTIIKKGDFVYNPRKSATAPFGPFNCYRLEEEGIVSPLYTCLTPKKTEHIDYLLWYFKTDRWYQYIQLNGAQSGARHDRVGMTNELMSNIPVTMPATINEMKCISSFLESLENLVTLQQHKLEQIKEYKKGLLQQMFV